MRNYDIEFDRENKKLHFTKSNCSKDFESDLNPKHQNKILQESHWPRILEINNNTNLSNSSDFNVILSNDSNNNTNNNNQTNEVVQDGYKDPDGKNSKDYQ